MQYNVHSELEFRLSLKKFGKELVTFSPWEHNVYNMLLW